MHTIRTKIKVSFIRSQESWVISFAYSMSSKLVSTIVSTFTAYYVHLWSTYFTDTPLSPPFPSFDGRAVCYPSVQNLRDYMSWRQVDCIVPMCLLYTTYYLCLNRSYQQLVQHDILVAGPTRRHVQHGGREVPSSRPISCRIV